MSDIQHVLDTIKEHDIEYLDVRFTDPRGKLQHVTVIQDEVDADFLEEGFMFDGSSIAGWKSIEQSDMKLMFDCSSAYIVRSTRKKRSASIARSLNRTLASHIHVTRAAQLKKPKLI